VKRSGLSPDAELVHRALSTAGSERLAVLSGELGLSAQRVKAAVTALHRAGLARPAGAGAHPRWTALPRHDSPGTPEARGHLPGHRPLPLPELVRPLADAVDLGVGLRHLTSRPATTKRLFDLYLRGPREVLGISPEPHLSEAHAKAAASASHWARKTGMVSLELGVLKPDDYQLVPYGGLVKEPDTYRQAREVAMKLIIIDRRFAFFPVDPGNFERGYLEVSQPPVVESLIALFQREWDRAGPQRQEPAMPAFHLTPREKAVVAQLLVGHTDAAAARALHLSERTISSVVRTMMERLEVRNRFQLGVALGRLGVTKMPPPPDQGGGGGANQDRISDR
jgi:DNA-binding CsgD family transcriptional regulator